MRNKKSKSTGNKKVNWEKIKQATQREKTTALRTIISWAAAFQSVRGDCIKLMSKLMSPVESLGYFHLNP